MQSGQFFSLCFLKGRVEHKLKFHFAESGTFKSLHGFVDAKVNVKLRLCTVHMYVGVIMYLSLSDWKETRGRNETVEDLPDE